MADAGDGHDLCVCPWGDRVKVGVLLALGGLVVPSGDLVWFYTQADEEGLPDAFHSAQMGI